MRNKSFTLIELLVVIVIIGILAGIIMISTSSSIEKANIAKIRAFENGLQNNLGAGMVSSWDANNVLKEGSSWRLIDKWGNNNDGTFYNVESNVCSETNCPQVVSDNAMGKAISFDGTDDYISCISKKVLNLEKSGTVSAWLYIPSSWTEGGSYPNLVSKGARNGWDTNGWALFVFLNGNIGVGMRNGSSVNNIAFNNTVKDKWIYITGSWNGAKIKIYRNGMLKNSRDQTVSPPETDVPLEIGKGGSNYFKGLVGDVKIYNEALSSAQIKQDYVEGLNSLFARGIISKEEYNQNIEALSFKD